MNAKLIEAALFAKVNAPKPHRVRWSRPRRWTTTFIRPVVRALAADRGSDWWREQS